LTMLHVRIVMDFGSESRSETIWISPIANEWRGNTGTVRRAVGGPLHARIVLESASVLAVAIKLGGAESLGDISRLY
jgi:hypothetical protein